MPATSLVRLFTSEEGDRLRMAKHSKLSPARIPAQAQKPFAHRVESQFFAMPATQAVSHPNRDTALACYSMAK